MDARRWAGRTPSPWFRLALLVGAAVLLVAIAVGAADVGPWVGRTPTDPSLPSFSLSLAPPTATSAPPSLTPLPTWSGGFGWLLPVLAAVLAAVLAVLLVIWWRQRARGSAGVHRPDAPEVPTLPAEPGGDLPFDPRAAAGFVIECWQTVERTAARAGHPRTPEQTPTEFLRALADAFPLDRAGAARLLRLYHHARFDHVALGPGSAAQARDTAQAVCAAVAAAVVARSSG